MRFKIQFKKPDLWLLIAVLALSLFGLLMVYDASVVLAQRDFGDKFWYLKNQALWLSLGLLVLLIATFFDYKKFYRFAPTLLLVSILLLIAVLIPGIGTKVLGARRWINLGAFTFQPAEIAKLTFVLYLSAWLSGGSQALKEKAFRLLPFLVLCGLMVGLVVAEPDLGTAIIIVTTGVAIYFLSGAPLKHFLTMIPILVSGIVFLILNAPYRMRRLLTFLDPTQDPQGASYHIRQILIALGSGGLLGLGIGQSRQKYEYLPEATTDSIFAIIAEELGFVGAVVVILIFLFIIYRGFKIASMAKDRFGMLLSLGITSLIAVQVLINLSSMVTLLPLTGVPLPFISYGGSSLIVNLATVGILLNISKQGIRHK